MVRRATFCPGLGEDPDPVEFLEHLCLKMEPDLWRHKHLDVLVYCGGISRT
jgi:hypothetical protein